MREVLPKELEEKVLDWVNLDMTASVDEMLAAVEPLITQAERDQEAGDVDTLEAQVNTIGGLGVAGVEATAEALSKGQVRLLIMLEGFQAPGSRNPQSGFLYSGMQTVDPIRRYAARSCGSQGGFHRQGDAAGIDDPDR